MSQHDNKPHKQQKQRKSVSALNSKKLYQEADNRCPFCGIADVAVLEIHHIDSDPSNSRIENLIVVCGNCHSKITRNEISHAEVLGKKVMLLSANKTSTHLAERTPKQSVEVTSENISDSIIANTVNLNRKRSQRMHYPIDSIGAETIKKGYIDYLIKRYFDYRGADGSYGKSRPFSYSEIHNTIHSKFKARTFYIHVSRFEELCVYIKDRIKKTIQGKRNHSNNIKNYVTFLEYKKEQLKNEY